jgi:LacI family transcriptional regulator
MSVTINDIARKLRLSKATVSKALNGYPDVSVETRALVMRAALELEYQPSAAARSLSLGRTGNIALFLNTSLTYVLEYLQGVLPDAVARGHAAGRQLILYPTASDSPDRLMRACRTGEYDGVLLFSPRYPQSLFDFLHALHMPFVVMGKQIADPRVSFITPDYYAGGRALVEHLLALGHRRIAMMNRSHIAITSETRMRAYFDALADAAIAPDPALVIDTTPDPETVAHAVDTWLALDRPPTAIIAFHDLLAVEAVHILARRGVRVPDDISLVGFDGLPRGHAAAPPLTTAQQPFAHIGARAVEMLIAQMEAPGTPPLREVVPVTLTVRASAAAPRLHTLIPGTQESVR